MVGLLSAPGGGALSSKLYNEADNLPSVLSSQHPWGWMGRAVPIHVGGFYAGFPSGVAPCTAHPSHAPIQGLLPFWPTLLVTGRAGTSDLLFAQLFIERQILPPPAQRGQAQMQKPLWFCCSETGLGVHRFPCTVERKMLQELHVSVALRGGAMDSAVTGHRIVGLLRPQTLL